MKNSNIFTTRQLHIISLMLAKGFAATYRSNPDLGRELLTAYRAMRRRIGKGKSGKRYGARAAHKACNPSKPKTIAEGMPLL